MKKGKIPPQTWTAWGMLWLIYAMNGSIREVLNRVSPYIIENYGVNATQLGSVQSVSLLTLALGAIPLGMWADKGGVGWMRKRRAIVLGFGYLIANLLCGFGIISGIWAIFFLLNAIRGFWSGAGEAIEVGQMMEWCPRERTGFFAGLHHTGYPWGTLLGGIIITFVLTANKGKDTIFGQDAWRSSFVILSGIGIIAWLIWYRYSNSTNYKKFQDNAAAAGYNTALGQDVEENFSPPPGLWKRCLKNPNILTMFFVSYACLFAFAGINFWLTPYITFIGNVDPNKAAAYSIVYTITGGLGQIFWGNLSDRIGSKRALLICTAWLAVTFILMQFAGVSLLLLVILQLVMGFALNAVYAMIYKYVAISSEKGAITFGNSLIVCGMYLGGASATFILGRIIDIGGGWTSEGGYLAGLYTLAAVMVVGFFITLLFTRETNGPKFKKDFSLVSLEACNLADIDDPFAVRKAKEEE
jgi:MFS family permease